MEEIHRTYCARMDHGGCGLLVTVREGRVVKVQGDPDSPISLGFVCPKGLAAAERVHHPDRLRMPLLRKGARGEGVWEEIGWPQALEILSGKIKEAIRSFGAQAVLFAQGAPKGLEFWIMMRLANALGSPNVAGIGNMCHMPREISSVITFGFWPEVDYDHPPACIVLWGSNLDQTNEEATISSRLRRALERGSRLMVVDPRPTRMAKRADIWLRLRPGSDAALAMGIMKVMLQEGLADLEFLRCWSVGLEELKQRLEECSLEKVEELTWVDSDRIREAARFYGTSRPAAIQMGNALEHTAWAHQSCRAVACLMALGGNLEVPGGNIRPSPPRCIPPRDLVLAQKLQDRRKKMLSSPWNLHPLLATVPAQMATETLLSGEPYPVRVAYFQGTNPMLSYPGSAWVKEALGKLDFLAVADIFMTPTAAMADLVLPAATHLEFNDIGNYGLPKSFILARPKVVEPPGEAWPDLKILNELAKSLGLGELFWEQEGQILEEVLAPSGLTYRQFKESLVLWGPREYGTYLKKGFNTPSGKIELYCQQLAQRGLDPLPGHPGALDSEQHPSREFPFVLTSAKDPVFFHSAYRQLASLRKISPEPEVEISPETAILLGLAQGDWVWVRTAWGKVRQRVRLVERLDPRVVCAAYGWWFPEKGMESFLGWEEANLNLLTSKDPPFDPLLGSVNLRGIPCSLEKVQDASG